RGFVVAAKLALDLLRGDTATRTPNEVHDVEPVGQRPRRLLKDRAGCRVDVVAASRTRPRLTPLLRVVALKPSRLIALRTVGVFSILGVALAPKVFQTGVVVGELAQELMQRVERL